MFGRSWFENHLRPPKVIFCHNPKKIGRIAGPVVKTSPKPRAIWMWICSGCSSQDASHFQYFWLFQDLELKCYLLLGFEASQGRWHRVIVKIILKKYWLNIVWLIQCLVGWTLGCLVCVLVGGVEPQQQPQPTAPTKHTLWDNAFCPLASCSTSWPVNFEDGFAK